MAPPYVFRPMTTADLPLVQRWLLEPHVAEWWHDPETFEFVSGDLDHPPWAQFIVALDGRPFAYLQCYRMSDWDTGFGPQPEGTRGIDQFIGEADMMGRGHGSAFVTAFVEELLRMAHRESCSIPSQRIARAIRAYEKAGFRQGPPGRYPRRRGPADGAQPMTLERNAVPAVARSFAMAMDADRGLPDRAAGRDPVCDGPAADLRLRLCQSLARRGAELGEFAAHRRLVHVLAHSPRLPVLRRHLAAAAEGVMAGAPDRRHDGRRRLGAGGEFRLDHQPLSHRHRVVRLFRRQHRQFGLRYAGDDRGLPAGEESFRWRRPWHSACCSNW